MTEEEEAAQMRADLCNKSRTDRYKLTPMQSAMAELQETPAYKNAVAERKAEEAEYERMSSIPVFLNVVGKGYAKKRDEEPVYMFRLVTAADEPDAADCWIAVPEKFTVRFSMEPQEFEVEVAEAKAADLDEIAEWVETQSNAKVWSMKLRTNRRRWQGRDGTLIFSFDDMQAAAVFKMMHG
jgi:hypothetical protein